MTNPGPWKFISGTPRSCALGLLATSPPELTLNHPELGDFALDKERTGLSDRYRFFLALFAGPYARSTGVVQALDFNHGRHFTLVEVAFPPFAYVMTIDSDGDPIESAPMFDVGYNQRADLELGLLIGFGHTAIPIDYRTSAMIGRARALNEAEAAK